MFVFGPGFLYQYVLAAYLVLILPETLQDTMGLKRNLARDLLIA